MASPEQKTFAAPDETREFEHGQLDLVRIGESDIGRLTLQPGWRWSEHVKPIVGTDMCEATHAMYVLSGRMGIAHEDGTEVEVGPGDVVVIEPEHDAWVVGDATFTAIDFGGYARYGLPKS